MSSTTATPFAAWVAAALAAFTLPIAAFPLVKLIHQAWVQHRQPFQSLSKSSSGKLNIFLAAVWAVAILAHIGLIAYAILAATETECCGQRSDFGWKEHDPPCAKEKTIRVTFLLEIATACVYPTIMLRTYIRLDPSRDSRLWKRMYRVAALYIVLITITHLINQFGIVVDNFTPTAAPERPGIHELIVFHRKWNRAVFLSWFASMICFGIVSLYLTIRLMPWLQKREASGGGRGKRASGAAVTVAAGYQPDSRDTSGSLSPSHSIAHGSPQTTRSSITESEALKADGGSGSPPMLAVTPSTFSRRASSAGTSVNWMKRKGSTLLRRRLSRSKREEAISVSRRRLSACLRRLRVFLGLILVILAWNLFMVFRRPFPDVLHTVTGWISCRMISVLLFAATREIRAAVVARRQIPNTEAGTLAATGEWEGGGGKGKSQDVING